MASDLRLYCVETGLEYPLVEGHVIGRDPDADIVMESDQVSRHHARIVTEQGGFAMEDMGSTNGLRVGGRGVQRVRLHPGQLIRMGNRTFQVLGEGVEDRTFIESDPLDDDLNAVVDDAEDGSTTFRGGYALPPGWSPDDYASVGTPAVDTSRDHQMLKELLNARRITSVHASAALMALSSGAGNRIFLLESKDAPSWTLGRSQNAAVHIENTSISGTHAVVSVVNGRWRIADEGSSNGTAVNGKRGGNFELNSGDAVTLGKARFVFHVLG